VDNSPPTANILFPINNTNVSKNILNITWTCNDIDNNGLKSYLYFNDSLIIETNFSNNTIIYDYSIYGNNTYNISLYCYDGAFNISDYVNFYISSISVTLIENVPITNLFDESKLTLPLIIFLFLLLFFSLALIVIGLFFKIFMFSTMGGILLMVSGMIFIATISIWMGVFFVTMGAVFIIVLGMSNYT